MNADNTHKKVIAFDKNKAFAETGLRTSILRLTEAVRTIDLAIHYANEAKMPDTLALEHIGYDLTVNLARAKELYHLQFPDNAIP